MTKYMDIKDDGLIDKDVRQQYFQSGLEDLLEKQDKKEFFRIKDEHRDFATKGWFFKILERNEEFCEFYFEELKSQKKRIYIELEEIRCFFSYYFFKKNQEKIVDFVQKVLECQNNQNFTALYGTSLHDFNSSLTHFQYMSISKEFFLELAYKIKETFFAEKSIVRPLIEKIVSTINYSGIINFFLSFFYVMLTKFKEPIMHQYNFMRVVPITFYAVVESIEEIKNGLFQRLFMN